MSTKGYKVNNKTVSRLVYLHDNYPSDISACVTIRQIVWNVISTIERGIEYNECLVDYCEITPDAEDSLGLPQCFGKQPARKKSRKSKKKEPAISLSKLTRFTETRCCHNLYMGFNEGDGLYYPCRVLGVGPNSSREKEYALVEFIGYGAIAELQRSSSLLCPIPINRYNEVLGFVAEETLCKCVGCVKELKKYYDQRYRLFSKYDSGIELDNESWFSVTPESIAIDIAEKCQMKATEKNMQIGVVLDCFCGVGGNAIAIAAKLNCQVVVAVDCDPKKINMLRKNSSIYEVARKIECVCDDAYNLLSRLKDCEKVVPNLVSNPYLTDLVILAPPWGGIEYTSSAFDLQTMITSGDGVDLFNQAARISKHIIYILPKHSNKRQLHDIGKSTGLPCIIEDVHLHGKLKMIVAYYGSMFL